MKNMSYLIALGLALTLGRPLVGNAQEEACNSYLKDHRKCVKTSGIAACQKGLVTLYTSFLYRPLNQALREGIKSSCDDLRKPLEAALASFPLFVGRVYRGAVYIPELGQLRVNDCYRDKGFVSTSQDASIARRFNFDNGGEVLTIDVSTGRSIEEMSMRAEEKEVVLMPGTWLKLMKEPKRERSLTFYTFKEVPPEDCD